MKLATFWTHFDESKLSAEILINSEFSTIKNWTLEELREVSINYRWLVKSHSDHLALMISKLPESRFKTLIADILNDEQGNGKYERSHLYLWDNFLRSIGVSDIPKSPTYSDPMVMFIQNSSIDFTIGLEGVGVECICAVYLEMFEKYLLEHPYIIQNKKEIDWVFFDIHVRGEDIDHKKQIRKAVEELIREGTVDPDLVILGYNKAKEIWRKTWKEWVEKTQVVPL